jgi:hypothetical protein
VILGDDERGADRADRKAEEQERLVRLREGQPEHRDRAEQQQPCIGTPRAEPVAERADHQPHQDRHRDRGDVDVGDLILAEPELGLDQRHQRCGGEPREEAHEEREPRDMERAHLRRGGTEQVDPRGFRRGGVDSR